MPNSCNVACVAPVQPPAIPPKPPEVSLAPHYYDRAPRPLQAFTDTVMLPFDFLSYPGRRDW